jgi:hypothetical protein
MRILSVFMLVSLSAPVFAQTHQAVEDCTRIKNDAVRLACYDNFFRVKENVEQVQAQADKQQPEPASAPVLVAPPTLAAQPSSVEPKKSLPAEPPRLEKEVVEQEILVSEKVNAQQSVQQTQDARVAQFGAEDLVRTEDSQDEALSRIDSVIEAVSENSREIRTFTLANGQMWRETTKNRLRLKEGMEVFVEKGALSAHYLGKESSNRRTRVKRVK